MVRYLPFVKGRLPTPNGGWRGLLLETGQQGRDKWINLGRRTGKSAAWNLEFNSTQCYILAVTDAEDTARVFKTAWFAKAARKALIDDPELCRAIAEVWEGQADDLGGGVFKKRLDKNRSRGIILAKGGVNWVYAYLFAKKDRDNIDDRELAGFRKLARTYEGLDHQMLDQLLKNGDVTEICHAREA